MEVPAKSSVRFAGFVLDLGTGELRSNGHKTNLQEKPFQILILLLERPGELVTRERLVKQLWPDGTFVDFDQSLNKAVNRLRQVLGDSADEPRLIETLPRRGYRFIGEIENDAATSAEPSASSPAKSSWKRWVAVSALVVMAIAIAFRWFEARRFQPNPLEDVKQRRLTANSSENAVTSGVISADGKLLAYSDLKGIHVQQIDTGQVRDIRIPESSGGTPQSWVLLNTWIRDGSAIIVNAAPSGQTPSVWFVPVSGEPMRKIRDNTYAWTVSRDGQWVAFGANLDKLYYRELWIMRPDGTDAHKVFDADKDAAFGGAEFSPDGRRLAYVKLRELPELGEMTFESRALDGGAATTALASNDSRVVEDWSWSPDGRMIYSLMDFVESACNFWQVRLDARTGAAVEKPKQLTNWSGFYMDHPSFSADGKRLTFLRSSLQSTLYLGDLRADETQLSAPAHLTLNEGQNDLVGWTPDSKTVVFVSDRNGHPELFRQAPGEDAAERIASTAGPSSVEYRMSPDGTAILYLLYPKELGTSQPVSLMRLPLAGGGPQLVLTSFVERHYCPEIVDRLADPLLSGIYGGEARKLSLRAVLPRFAEMEASHGSLARALLSARQKTPSPNGKPLFTSLKNGMQQLVDAVASHLPPTALHLNTPVQAIQSQDSGWVVSAGYASDQFDAVILATSAQAAANLGLPAELNSALRAIEYTSSVTTALAYNQSVRQSLPPGFGFLVPRSEGNRMLAVTFVHNKFLHRAPEDRALIRCFLGGARHPAILDQSDDEILRVVRQELRQILNLTVEPVFTRVYRWKDAMAQYNVGHIERIQAIERACRELPGLALAGNAYHGIGIPDCVRSGTDAANHVLQGLRLLP